jgi:hypothetical protein
MTIIKRKNKNKKRTVIISEIIAKMKTELKIEKY